MMRRALALVLILWTVPLCADTIVVIRRVAATTSTSTSSTTTTTTSTVTTTSAAGTTTTSTSTTSTTTLVESTTGLFLPTGAEPDAQANTTNATDTNRCTDFILDLGYSNATSIAWGLAGSFSNTCSVALFADAGATLIRTTGSHTCVNTTNPTTVTGLSAFSLSPDVVYRLCWCASSSSGQYAGLADAEASRIMSGFSTVHHGTAANACTGGVQPSTTGTLTADYSFPSLSVRIE